MVSYLAQIGTQLTAAFTAAIVTAAIGLVLTALRYVFDVQLATQSDVDEKIEAANADRQDDFDEILTRLDEHKEVLTDLEELIMGSEYQVSDGMLELVEINAEEIESHDERIDGVERIQLKIRRRQAAEGEHIAGPEDLDPPPDYDTDRNWGNTAEDEDGETESEN